MGPGRVSGQVGGIGTWGKQHQPEGDQHRQQQGAKSSGAGEAGEAAAGHGRSQTNRWVKVGGAGSAQFSSRTVVVVEKGQRFRMGWKTGRHRGRC